MVNPYICGNFNLVGVFSLASMCSIVLYYVMLYCITLCCLALYFDALGCIVLCCVILCMTEHAHVPEQHGEFFTHEQTDLA